MRGSSLLTKPLPFTTQSIAGSVPAVYFLNEAVKLKPCMFLTRVIRGQVSKKVFER